MLAARGRPPGGSGPAGGPGPRMGGMARGFRFDARLPSWLAGLLLACLGCGALGQQADPPGRVAFVSLQQGSVVFAPLGAEDWQQLPPNRPLTEGDRLWTDPAARAELQLGTATLHLGSVTQLRLGLLEERVARFILQQGTANARVRDLQPDEDFEIDTPNLALRALQPGDYRLDVDPRTQSTRVIVHGGQVDVFGENGQALRMAAGQQATFTGRALAQVEAPYAARDEFGLWAQDRNRAQDQALAARYVPPGVVGAPQLDA